MNERQVSGSSQVRVNGRDWVVAAAELRAVYLRRAKLRTVSARRPQGGLEVQLNTFPLSSSRSRSLSVLIWVAFDVTCGLS